MSTITFTVADGTVSKEKPVRLDTYAASQQGISRSRLKNGVTSITVNGKAAKLSSKLTGGETVSVSWEDPVPEDIVPENIPLEILYEDENVTVVNKAQGMVTHPAAGNWSGTLVNALLYRWGYAGATPDADTAGTAFGAGTTLGAGIALGGAPTNEASFALGAVPHASLLRPGIVHRLDKDTSGCIITARNRETEEYLQKQFQSRRVHKEYIAVVQGHLPLKEGEVRTQILRDPKNRKRFTTGTDPNVGKFAWTKYRVVAVYGPYSLVRLSLRTGRTHQIRVHLRSLGCPILGDPIYGKRDSLFTDATLMLHARRLCLRLPETSGDQRELLLGAQGQVLVHEREPAVFTAPVPVRFKKVMRTLHVKYPKDSYEK